MKCGSLLFRIALGFLFAGPALGTTCTIYDINSLKACLSQGADYLDFQGDVTCSGADCCGVDGGGLINLNARSYVTINGNGHLIRRTENQYSCPALRVYGSNNISIVGLRIDEGEETPRCLGKNPFTCVTTVEFTSSSSIYIEDFGVYNAKLNGILVEDVDGFNLNNSVVSNAGVLGVYVGSQQHPSTNVWITNSVIAHSGANGLTLQGVHGDVSDGLDNVIRGNVFNTNHIFGAFNEGVSPPNFNDGGQVYIAEASSVAFDYNLIADGHCFNCIGFTPRYSPWTEGAVPAFEFGASPTRGGGPIDYVLINSNKIRNVHGAVYVAAQHADIRPTTAIWGNDIKGALAYVYTHRETGFRLRGPTFGYDDRTEYSPSGYTGGYLSNYLFRMYNYSNGRHHEANWTWQHPNAGLIQTFMLAGYPRPRASSKPIYRCLVSSGTGDDFVSFDMNCEGFLLHSVLGYSFEPDYPGAVPIYRCLIGYEHFVTSDPGCGGFINEGMYAYGVLQ